jgi:hypothetical protein
MIRVKVADKNGVKVEVIELHFVHLASHALPAVEQNICAVILQQMT